MKPYLSFEVMEVEQAESVFCTCTHFNKPELFGENKLCRGVFAAVEWNDPSAGRLAKQFANGCDDVVVRVEQGTTGKVWCFSSPLATFSLTQGHFGGVVMGIEAESPAVLRDCLAPLTGKVDDRQFRIRFPVEETTRFVEVLHAVAMERLEAMMKKKKKTSTRAA